MKFREHFHQDRLLYALLGAILFVVVGMGAPDLYFKYFDRTEYFSVEQPVHVDQHVYSPGDKVSLTLVRTVLAPANVHGVVELILVDANNAFYKKTLSTADFNIDISEKQVVHTSYDIPQDVGTGDYFIKAVLTYRIKSVEKTYVWQTESFQVRTASDSAKLK